MRHLFPLLPLLVVGCGPLFPFGGETNDDYARSKAEQLTIYAKSWSAKNDDRPLESIHLLTEYAEDGDKAVIDPWGQQFRFTYVAEPETQKVRIVVWTVNPKSGKLIAAPKHLEHLLPPPN